jgi:hypothetical protein
MHQAGRGIPITRKWHVEIGEIPRLYLWLSGVFGFIDEFGTSVKICRMAWSLPDANFGRRAKKLVNFYRFYRLNNIFL